MLYTFIEVRLGHTWAPCGSTEVIPMETPMQSSALDHFSFWVSNVAVYIVYTLALSVYDLFVSASYFQFVMYNHQCSLSPTVHDF